MQNIAKKDVRYQQLEFGVNCYRNTYYKLFSIILKRGIQTK